MRSGFAFWFFLVSIGLQAQLAYQGKVVDVKTGLPIPFVNIGIIERQIGTVSNEDGEFLLEFRRQEVAPGDILRVSSLGYQTRDIPLSRLNTKTKSFIFYLEPEAISLNEVVLTDREFKEVEKELGYPDLLGKGIGYWKDSVALGGELASRIRIKKGLFRLNTLFFNILENPSDSVQLRINIYERDGKTGFPGENLNKSGRNILYTLKKGALLSVVDLRPFDLWVRDDFFVSLELLGVHGTEEIGLSLPAGKVAGGRSFRKIVSQGRWNSIYGTGVVGYHLQATLFTDDPKRMESPRQKSRRLKKEREISGYVFRSVVSTSRDNPKLRTEGAQIVNYTRNVSVYTNEWGRYSIRVAPGDILGIYYPGTYPLMIRVDKPRNFNFQLHRRGEIYMKWSEE